MHWILVVLVVAGGQPTMMDLHTWKTEAACHERGKSAQKQLQREGVVVTWACIQT